MITFGRHVAVALNNPLFIIICVFNDLPHPPSHAEKMSVEPVLSIPVTALTPGHNSNLIPALISWTLQRTREQSFLQGFMREEKLLCIKKSQTEAALPFIKALLSLLIGHLTRGNLEMFKLFRQSPCYKCPITR